MALITSGCAPFRGFEGHEDEERRQPNSYFEFMVILLIAANSICLAMYDPMDPGVRQPGAMMISDWNKNLAVAGTVFTVVFTVEMFVKIFAKGFIIGKHAYLRESPWNWLDFLVVVTGYTDFIPNYENNLGVFRTIRLLRPLRR